MAFHSGVLLTLALVGQAIASRPAGMAPPFDQFGVCDRVQWNAFTKVVAFLGLQRLDWQCQMRARHAS